jgi:hypothetical protein
MQTGWSKDLQRWKCFSAPRKQTSSWCPEQPRYGTKLTYTTYSTNHPDGKAHASSPIIIRKCIKHHELTKYETAHIQTTDIGIKDWDGNLTISAIYYHPRHTIKKEQYNDFINSLGYRFLIGGDFSAKHQYWGSSLMNPKGRKLRQTIQEKQLEILSTGYQRIGQHIKKNSRSTRLLYLQRAFA